MPNTDQCLETATLLNYENEPKDGMFEIELDDSDDVNPVWDRFGSDIDHKLKAGSIPIREEVLNQYASNIKSAKSDEELKEAVNDVQPFHDKEIKESRGLFGLLGFFGVVSETYTVATDFQEKVNISKGWE